MSGLTQQDLEDLATVGASHFLRTGKDLGAWSLRMVNDLGEWVEPFLEQAFVSSCNKLTDELATLKQHKLIRIQHQQDFFTLLQLEGQEERLKKQWQHELLSDRCRIASENNDPELMQIVNQSLLSEIRRLQSQVQKLEAQRDSLHEWVIGFRLEFLKLEIDYFTLATEIGFERFSESETQRLAALTDKLENISQSFEEIKIT